MRVIQIKNRPLRVIVSTFAFLLMTVAGVAVLGVIFYGVGRISPLNLINPDENVFFTGFITIFFAAVVVILVYVTVSGIYEGIKKLYNGPFSPSTETIL